MQNAERFGRLRRQRPNGRHLLLQYKIVPAEPELARFAGKTRSARFWFLL